MNRLDKPVKPLLASLPALANTFRSNDWAFKYVVLKINIKIEATLRNDIVILQIVFNN
jgi:hypothetical protein